MVLVKYVIICSPTVIEDCNQGNTIIDSITIGGILQMGIENFRLADKPCTFLNTEGVDIQVAGTQIKVVVNATLTSNLRRTFQIYLCINDRILKGSTKSDPADDDGSVTLNEDYTQGTVVDGGADAFLRKKAGVNTAELASALPMPAQGMLSKTTQVEVDLSVSEKIRTKQVIKRIIGK